jgi:uncharacterized membrane protein
MPNISFSQEPAVWIGLITAVIDAVTVFFPTSLNSEQKTTLVGLVTVLVPVILSFVVRQNVTPNAKVTPTAQNVVVAVPAPPTPVNPQVPPTGV